MFGEIVEATPQSLAVKKGMFSLGEARNLEDVSRGEDEAVRVFLELAWGGGAKRDGEKEGASGILKRTSEENEE